MIPESWRPHRLTGHLGTTVSALVDGQLDEAQAERAWDHVVHCPPCRRLVEREGWIKRQLTQVARAGDGTRADVPPDRLVGSLLDLGPVAQAWADVEDIEHRGRARRRAGIALVGAGGVSAAVLGLSTLAGAPLGLGGTHTPAGSLGGVASSSRPAAPAPSPTSTVVAPVVAVHGRLHGWRLGQRDHGVARAQVAGDRP